MVLLFMSVTNYQTLESQILALTYDVLSISSHSNFYSECVALNYHPALSSFPARTAFQVIYTYLMLEIGTSCFVSAITANFILILNMLWV